MRELIRLVSSFGLTLHGARLNPGIRGLYVAEEGRVYFDLALTPNERRATVAHELGHFHYGHECSTTANERQADGYAARLLIRAEDYAAVARVNSDRAHVADELGVTVDIVEAYESQVLSRIGEGVYSDGRRVWRTEAHLS